MLVHVVADYGPAGDLAFAEVTQRLVAVLPAATFAVTPVGPFDTLAAGFVIAQLALNEGPGDRIVFHNVAPRRDESDPRRANEGERFTLAAAPNGTLIGGPNAGHSLSFIRDETALSYLDVPAAGSQFRLRDFLPAAVGRLAAGDRDVISGPVPVELVPELFLHRRQRRRSPRSPGAGDARRRQPGVIAGAPAIWRPFTWSARPRARRASAGRRPAAST